MIRTIGAAIGAVIVILLFASVASKVTTHYDPDTAQAASARR